MSKRKHTKKDSKKDKKPKLRQPLKIKLFRPRPFSFPTSRAEVVEILNYADENGFVYFKDIATQEELQEAESLFWAWAGKASTNLKRDDPTTWKNANWFENFSAALIKYEGICINNPN